MSEFSERVRQLVDSAKKAMAFHHEGRHEEKQELVGFMDSMYADLPEGERKELEEALEEAALGSLAAHLAERREGFSSFQGYTM